MEMELTESVLMDVTEQHSRLLQQLRQLGLQISIDDFGTGYSSLNYLTLHPINRLKMARELVSRVATDPRCATVVRATIRLAAELGIELLAEGVEDARQASFLARAGCQDVQGYYFSRPVDARAATSLLRAGTIDVAERHHERAS
jgi:EAL domain-containing protein (putative c-di-GMP-specific phosphodiesterase class I)